MARFFDRLILIPVALVLVMLISPWLNQLADAVYQTAYTALGWPSWIATLGFLLLVGSIACRWFATNPGIQAIASTRHHPRYRSRHRRFLAYPGPLVLALVAASGYGWLNNSIRWTWVEPTCIASTLLILWMACPGLIRTVRKINNVPGKLGEEFEEQAILTSFEALKEWIEDDAPITRPKQALFGAKETAKQVFDALTAEEAAVRFNPPSIALLGPVGSGKTTIGKLVEYHCFHDHPRDQPQTVICHISAWSYATNDALYRGVVQAIVNGLARFTPAALGLIQLPAEYAEAVGKVNGVLGVAAKLATRGETPEKLIARAGRLARDANLNIVLWMDDSERFDAQADTERTKIESLLWLIRETEALTFVLARATDFGGKTAFFDTHKLVTHKTDVRSPESEEIFQVIRTFREKCRGLQEDAEIPDPQADPKDRPLSLLDNKNIQGISLFALAAYGHGEALIGLLDTPRKLKFVFRNTLAAWVENNLMGEIEFDSLLLLHALLEAPPFRPIYRPSPTGGPQDAIQIGWYDLLKDPAVQNLLTRSSYSQSNDPQSLSQAELVAKTIIDQRDSDDPGVKAMQALFRWGSATKAAQNFIGEHGSIYLNRALSLKRKDRSSDRRMLTLLGAIRNSRNDNERSTAVSRLTTELLDCPREDHHLDIYIDQYINPLVRLWRGMLFDNDALDIIQYLLGRLIESSDSPRDFKGDFEIPLLRPLKQILISQVQQEEKPNSLWSLKRSQDIVNKAVLSAATNATFDLAIEIARELGPDFRVMNNKAWWAAMWAELADSIHHDIQGALINDRRLDEKSSTWSMEWLIAARWMPKETRPPVSLWHPFGDELIKIFVKHTSASGNTATLLTHRLAAKLIPLAINTHSSIKLLGKWVKDDEPLIKLFNGDKEKLRVVWEQFAALPEPGTGDYDILSQLIKEEQHHHINEPKAVKIFETQVRAAREYGRNELDKLGIDPDSDHDEQNDK